MATIATPVTNPFHIEYIQENQVFTVTENLGLTTCGICSIVDVLTVVDAESPVVTAHGYAGSTNCRTIALCPDCYEDHADSEYEEEFQGCNLCGAPAYVARVDEYGIPYHFAYEGYPTVYSVPVAEPSTGKGPNGIRLAGTYWRFATEDERDMFVASGPGLVQYNDGLRYCHRRACDYDEVVLSGLDVIV